MNTFVIPDIHGDLGILYGLLHSQGIVNRSWERIDKETTVVQLGDLAHCVSASTTGDEACLGKTEEWFDVYLIGNHEHPYFGGPRFNGFWLNPVIGHKLQLLNGIGLIKAAHAVDGILLTHAGVIEGATLDNDIGPGTSEEWASVLNDLWQRNTIHPIFSTIGESRGGSARNGGILWSDFSEPKHDGFPQIVGHTVDEKVRLRRRPFAEAWGPPQYPFEINHGDVLCLDIGSDGTTAAPRIAGCWIREGTVEVVFYNRNSEISE